MTINVSEAYRRMSCSECGVVYYFSDAWCQRATSEGRSWYCPNKHGQTFGESEADKLRRERDRLKQENARLEEDRNAAYDAEQKAIAEKKRVAAQLKRAQKRSAAGVCPCCNRTVSQMADHIATNHPEYAKEHGVVVPLKTKASKK